MTRSTRWLYALAVVTACGGDGAGADSGPDAGGLDGSGDAAVPACSAPASFAAGLAPTRELHVATTGTLAGDGSVAAPFATIDQAAGEALPGTAIIVHAGTYSGGRFLNGLTGTAAAPIWIGGAVGEARPVLAGGESGMHITRPRYLVLHDLEIRGATANGINIDDRGDVSDPEAAGFIAIERVHIHDIGAGGNQDCLKLSGVRDFVVLDSIIERCGGSQQGSGIDMVGCHRGVIARNTFQEMSGNAVQTKGGSSEIDIRQNRMIDGGARAVNLGGSTDFQYFRPPLSTTSPNAEARAIRVWSNLIVRGDAALAFVGCVDCLAAYNTLVDPRRWPIRILQETTSSGGFTFEPASRGRVIGNVITFNDGTLSAHVNSGADTAPTTFTFSNNLWYAHDNPAQSTPVLPVAEANAVIGLDPGDVTLGCAGGPRDDRGVVLPEAPGDLFGACRGAPPDLGALETLACAR